MTLDVTAWLRTIFARFDEAGDLFERALRVSEQVGDELEIVMALGNMAALYRSQPGRCHASLREPCLGSSASRRPSPSGYNHSTVSEMADAGP